MGVRRLGRALLALLPAPVRLWVRSRQEWQAGRAEIGLLQELWEPGRTFVDVGANLGLYTRGAVAHRMKVVAIEPNPSLADNLERLFPRGVRVVRRALSDRAGNSTFYLPVTPRGEIHSRGSLGADANPGYALRALEVETIPLDALRLTDVAIVKIDVEGHELAVLRGATELLARDRPTLLVEIEERHHVGGSADVFRFLAERDYRCYCCWRFQLCPIESFDLLRQCPRHMPGPPGGSAPADYVNNFLFVWQGNDAVLKRLPTPASLTR